MSLDSVLFEVLSVDFGSGAAACVAASFEFAVEMWRTVCPATAAKRRGEGCRAPWEMESLATDRMVFEMMLGFLEILRLETHKTGNSKISSKGKRVRVASHAARDWRHDSRLSETKLSRAR